MVDKPIRDRHLLEAMEACRPQSADLSDPALAFLAAELAPDPALREQFERLGRFDRAVGDVLADVPVPEGLDRRILSRLARAQREHAGSDGLSGVAKAGVEPGVGEADAVPSKDPAAAQNSAIELPDASALASATGMASMIVPARPVPRGPRRWWLAASGAVAAVTMAAAVVVILLAGYFRASPPSMAQLLDAAIADAAAQFHTQRLAGEPADRVGPPQGFPISRQVVALPGTRWRNAVLGEGRAVAFDLALRGRARATLYVLQSRVANLPALPPSRPQANTGGYCALAWQEQGLVYVLVVAGDDPADWRAYLDVPLGPVA